jgi:phosphate transport system permease protein
VDAGGNSNTAITALAFLIGDRSLIVGDEAGDVSVWFQIEDPTSPKGKRLKKIHVLDSLEIPITAISPSPRNRGFLTADQQGNVVLYHATSEQKLLQLNAEKEKINALSFSPKANGFLAIDQKGTLYDWHIDNPHPETTLKTLFGKVWYEGYSKPEYVWQSTGGTDDFEPKFSLTPLAYGTLKGAFYALFFAIPLSILGAICVSQFMHPSLRNTIKPVIEIMAALPSVVLGFFAGLWLAPYIEKIVPAVFLMPLVITIFTLLSVFVWQYVPKSIKGRFMDGTELFLLIPVIILGVLISLWLNTPIEGLLFGGDYKGWLYNVLGLQYDQRNALIVGFAMGFAVIPIIFTISEDALSSVPRNLTAGSFALGATRWQTAIKVILPTASAGIFSAVMIGLGRAVGETMIVLMATGNTPLMDWSIFNGFRALSANIAVEIPEAPFGGTLYRVLFLAALLLFLVTFIVNTAAELVRQRLRRKFGQL